MPSSTVVGLVGLVERRSVLEVVLDAVGLGLDVGLGERRLGLVELEVATGASPSVGDGGVGLGLDDGDVVGGRGRVDGGSLGRRGDRRLGSSA